MAGKLAGQELPRYPPGRRHRPAVRLRHLARPRRSITAGGFSIDRRQVVLDKPIKTLGLHTTRIALHPEVVVQVTLNVARSEDEAERQARGEDVTVIKEEKIELETFDADAVFEDEALARQKADDGEEPTSDKSPA